MLFEVNFTVWALYEKGEMKRTSFWNSTQSEYIYIRPKINSNMSEIKKYKFPFIQYLAFHEKDVLNVKST